MTRSRLLLAVAAVLAGATVLFVVLGAAFNPVLVAAAVPFGLATYLLWLHGTGRLAARVRRRSARESPRAPGRQAAGSGPAGTGGRTAGAEATGQAQSLDRREALEVLGLSRGADQRAIRRAYRERAKAVHPDAAEGDEDAFRRVTSAYERLRTRQRGKG